MVNMEKVNIICLYWHGNFRGRNFSSDDVHRLWKQVDANISRPYDFYVLTNRINQTYPGQVIKLDYEWPGWWSKMELHRPDLPEGRTLYIDLDTTIVKNIDSVFDYLPESNLIMGHNRMKVKPRPSLPKVVYKYQAGIMLFTPNTTTHIYNRFLEDPDYWMHYFRSDQDLMGEWLPNQPYFPKKWVDKLSLVYERGKLPDTYFVTGQPKRKNFRDYEPD